VRLALTLAVLLAPAASMAQVKVIISGGFSAAYREVLVPKRSARNSGGASRPTW
jgi:hypothetical protein